MLSWVSWLILYQEYAKHNKQKYIYALYLCYYLPLVVYSTYICLSTGFEELIQ